MQIGFTLKMMEAVGANKIIVPNLGLGDGIIHQLYFDKRDINK